MTRELEMRVQILKKTAREFMTPRVITAFKATNGQVLARQLLSGLFSGLPVIESDGAVVGVVTEFDLLKAFKEGKDLQSIKAEEIMSLPPLCVDEETTLEIVLQRMTEHKVTRLPVVRNQKVVGVVSRANILSQLLDTSFPSPHIISLCYWCEKVCEDPDTKLRGEAWCDLEDFLNKHQLTSQDVSFLHTFCPACAPQVRKLMGEKYSGGTPDS